MTIFNRTTPVNHHEQPKRAHPSRSLDIPSALFLLTVLVRPAEADFYKCNVCQNPEYGARYLANPAQSFINPSTSQRWTCGELQDAVQDVDPTTSGAAGEAYLCTVYQIYAEQYCTCTGPDVPSLIYGPYEDINPSCNLCRGYSLHYVPEFNVQRTIDTGAWGTQNCLGLYEAALDGNVLDEEACEEINEHYEECCSLPELPIGTWNTEISPSRAPNGSSAGGSSPSSAPIDSSGGISPSSAPVNSSGSGSSNENLMKDDDAMDDDVQVNCIACSSSLSSAFERKIQFILRLSFFGPILFALCVV